MDESVDLILCDPRNRLAGEVRIQLKAVAGRGVEDVQLGTHQPGKGRLARPSESVRLDEAVRLGAGESGGAGHRRATLRAVDTRPRSPRDVTRAMRFRRPRRGIPGSSPSASVMMSPSRHSRCHARASVLMGWLSGGGGCEGSPPRRGGALGVEDEAVDLVLSEPAHRLAGYVGVEFHSRAVRRTMGRLRSQPRIRLRRTNGTIRMTGTASSGEPSRITIQ